jgi:hypothetical protein
VKPDEARVRAANLALFTPPPVIKPILETSRDTPADWRYTTTAPADAWVTPAFEDTSCMIGPGGFGTRNTPGSAVRTNWTTADIWLRRTFELPAGFAAVNPHLVLHHDEDAEIYINGVLALKVAGYSTDYEFVPMTPEGRAALKPGHNMLAVHCHQTPGAIR